jgi:hypothetical protein
LCQGKYYLINATASALRCVADWQPGGLARHAMTSELLIQPLRQIMLLMFDAMGQPLDATLGFGDPDRD